MGFEDGPKGLGVGSLGRAGSNVTQSGVTNYLLIGIKLVRLSRLALLNALRHNFTKQFGVYFPHSHWTNTIQYRHKDRSASGLLPGTLTPSYRTTYHWHELHTTISTQTADKG